MSYFRPRSVTWWSGVFALVVGLSLAFIGDVDPAAGGPQAVLAILAEVAATLGGGDASPAALIALGAGLIGIRAKQERDNLAAEARHDEMMHWEAESAAEDAAWEAQERERLNPYQLPDGESPLPEGVIDPFGEDGSR